MEFYQYDNSTNVRVTTSRFNQNGGAEEIHLVATPVKSADISTQIKQIETAYQAALSDIGISPDTTVFRRLFVSDYINQAPALESWLLISSKEIEGSCAVSIIEQPPLGQGKVVLWAYHIYDHENGISKHSSEYIHTVGRRELVNIFIDFL